MRWTSRNVNRKLLKINRYLTAVKQSVYAVFSVSENPRSMILFFIENKVSEVICLP